MAAPKRPSTRTTFSARLLFAIIFGIFFLSFEAKEHKKMYLSTWPLKEFNSSRKLGKVEKRFNQAMGAGVWGFCREFLLHFHVSVFPALKTTPWAVLETETLEKEVQ